MSRRGKSYITDTLGTSLVESFDRVASGIDDEEAVRVQRPTRTRTASRRASRDDTRISHPEQSGGLNVEVDRGVLQPTIPEEGVAFDTAPTQRPETKPNRSPDKISISIHLFQSMLIVALTIV